MATPKHRTSPSSSDPADVVGTFVGFGVEHISRHDGEWLVDPETGCISAVDENGTREAAPLVHGGPTVSVDNSARTVVSEEGFTL